MIEKEEPRKVSYSEDWVYATCPYCGEESIGRTCDQAYNSLTVDGHCDACGKPVKEK